MEELVKEIADLKALVNRLLLRIEELEAENADLRRQLGQNSSNSHKPPSSEGYSNHQEKSREARVVIRAKPFNW